MIKKVKIRDLTVEQRKKICDKQCREKDCATCPFYTVTMDKDAVCLKFFHNSILCKEYLDKEVEVEEPDILTKDEKEWLKNLLNGLGQSANNIRLTIGFQDMNFICLETKSSRNVIYVRSDWFKEMEADRVYTLEELGL